MCVCFDVYISIRKCTDCVDRCGTYLFVCCGISHNMRLYIQHDDERWMEHHKGTRPCPDAVNSQHIHAHISTQRIVDKLQATCEAKASARTLNINYV